MTSTSQKWLIGCGSGCAVIVAVVAGLVIGGFYFVRDKIRPLQEASDSRRQIVAELGAPETFVPPPDGAIAPDRMEVFLSVRDSLADARERLDGALKNFDPEELSRKNQSFGEVLRMLNDLSGVIPPIGEYIGRRNRALLDRRMGLGEYGYTYSVAYHSFLGHVPEEGPPALAKLRFENRRRYSDGNSDFTPEAVRGQYRRLITRLLTNQLNGIEKANGTWRETVKREIDHVERSMDRVAWGDNLPRAIEESLQPYKSRLQSTYRSSTNCFELLTLEESRDHRWSLPEQEAETGSRRSESGPAEAPPEVKAMQRAEAGGGTLGGLAETEVSYTVGNGVTAPVPIVQPAPAYTDEARSARVEGAVAIQAIVRRDGRLAAAKLVRRLGHGLDESALSTLVRDWRFKPGRLNGQPVDVPARIEITFHLK